ncbi:hypothetical protein Q7P37_006425 [Cladosporium fusiforme]
MADQREASTESEWAGFSESNAGDGDDDMDFELASSTLNDEDDDTEQGETTVYFDAEEGTFVDEDGEEVRVDVEGEEDEELEEGDDGQTTDISHRPHTITITQQQIMQLLSQAGLRGIFAPSGGGGGGPRTRSHGQRHHVALDEDEEEADDDDGEFVPFGRNHRRRARGFTGDRYPKIPSEEGQKLMGSGKFGACDRCDHTSCGQPFEQNTQNKRRRLARRMFDRELGVGSRGRARVLGSLASQDLIPSSKADMIINLNDRCYSGQFSEDGSFFFACGQDFKVRMYDTSNPYDWKYYKTVNYYGGQWTITDATLSPDNKHLAYSSIKSDVCLAATDPADSSEPRHLDFSNMGGGGSERGWGRGRNGHFGVWSLRFSGDGDEIVAGTSDYCVYVYDLEAQRSILRIPGHQDDVNAVCFGDKMSPHILYSGSDDTTLKVWDRRSLSSMRPAGMFLGHTEGLTYIDSKGDGRYVISNAKDQTCKLWDLRKMVSTDVGERINPQDYTTNFDYRFSPYDTLDHTPHPHDCSLVTFRGHRVLKTLIRCHFSPPTSTDQRYIYSGSHDGRVHIWNLDGTPRAQIDVQAATMNSRPASDERFADRYDYYGRTGTWKTIVRDASWHPSAPVVAATSWNGWDHGLGTTTVHSWNDGVEGPDEIGADDHGVAKASSLGSTPMGARVTAQLRHDARYYGEAQEPRRTRRTRGFGAIWGDDE